jgi:hypothetical protein
LEDNFERNHLSTKDIRYQGESPDISSTTDESSESEESDKESVNIPESSSKLDVLAEKNEETSILKPEVKAEESRVILEASSGHDDSSAESSTESEQEINYIVNTEISNQKNSSITNWPRANASAYSAGRAPQTMFSHKPTSIIQELELMPLMGNSNITEDNCFMPCNIL